MCAECERKEEGHLRSYERDLLEWRMARRQEMEDRR